jgi:tRNA (guanine-N7-)-methyltransferase
LHLATDWHNYAEQMLLVLNAESTLSNTSTEQIELTTFAIEDASNSEELKDQRVIGYMPPQRFVERLKKVLAN